MDIEERVAALETLTKATGQAVLMLEDAVSMHERLLNCILHFHPEALDTIQNVMDHELLLTMNMSDDEIGQFQRFWSNLSASLAARDLALATEAMAEQGA